MEHLIDEYFKNTLFQVKKYNPHPDCIQQPKSEPNWRVQKNKITKK